MAGIRLPKHGLVKMEVTTLIMKQKKKDLDKCPYCKRKTCIFEEFNALEDCLEDVEVLK